MIIKFETNLTKTESAISEIQALLEANDCTGSVYAAPIDGQDRQEMHILGTVNETLHAQLTALVKGAGEVMEHHSPFPRIGCQADKQRFDFNYNGVNFSDKTFHLFAGLCAVDSKDSAERMMKACQDNGLVCTRMGAFKPRTSPYSFQGHGADCLPYVFESAGKHGIKVIAMEVMAPEHIEAIHKALEASGQPTGVMLQIGTRNCQNVSLLHAVGTQQDYPVLLKRGFGVSLHESLFAAEHIAAAGNCNMIFCLRGVKSIGAAPHRNLVDFGHISTIKRLTRLGVCADPSHSAGSRAPGVDGFSDIQQASAQAVISGVNMLLVDFHPQSDKALCDGHQALPVEQLPLFIQDMALCRQTYEQRCQLMDRNG